MITEILGLETEIGMDEGEHVTRVIVIAATEHVSESGQLVAGLAWGSSSMDSDHRVGMMRRAQLAIEAFVQDEPQEEL